MDLPIGARGRIDSRVRDAGASILEVLMSVLLLGLPLIMVGLAFIDAARRPEWAWALAGRRRVMWMAMLIAGGATVIAAPFFALAYFFIARRDVAAAERGVPYVIVNRGPTDQDGHPAVTLRLEGDVVEVLPPAVQHALS